MFRCTNQRSRKPMNHYEGTLGLPMRKEDFTLIHKAEGIKSG